MTFAGRVGLITGAGSGIGRATARILAERGGAVVVADVNRVAAEETAAQIRAAGGRAEACACDVTRAEDVDAAVALARRSLGRLDIVVNCAGILRVAPLEDTSEKEWEEVLAVNLTGAFLLTRSALRALREQGGGRSSTSPRAPPSGPRRGTAPTRRRRPASSSSRRWLPSRARATASA